MLFRQHLWEHALHISPYSLSIQCILSLFSDLDIVLYCNSSSIVEVKLLPLRQQARKQFDAEFATRPLLKKMDFDNTEENYSIYKVGAFFDLGNRTPPRPLALEGWASDMLLSGIWGCYMLIFVEIVPSIGAIYVLAILTPFLLITLCRLHLYVKDMCCAIACFLLFKGNHSKWAFKQKKHLNARCVPSTSQN